jgi:serine/threonine protein kinase
MDKLTSKLGYTLNENPIGKGSFGTVYSGVHIDQGNGSKTQIVAKRLSKRVMSERGLNEQLRNEMTIHKKLKHKNIVKYLDELNTPQDIFIILEKCNSETLEKILTNYFIIFKKQLVLKINLRNTKKNI